jgi:hypothetical protein
MTTSSYNQTTLLQDPIIANDPALLHAVQNNFGSLNLNLNGPASTSEDSQTNPLLQTYNDRRDALLNYYKEQEDSTKKKADTNSMADEASYQNTVNTLNQGLGEDTATLADTEGQKGTWGSSARAERQNSLANKYNEKYTTAYDTATKNMGLDSVANQEKLGSNFYSPTVNKYQAGINGLSSQVGDSYRYNPFAQKSGSIAGSRAYSLAGLSSGK